MSKKVLLVDDEDSILEFLGMRIRSWGYELATAANGAEGLSVFSNEKVDAVILDYMMPDMDGIEVLKKIRSKDKKIPVIMFTAQPAEKNIHDADKLHISAFVSKISPYTDTSNALKSALHVALRKEGDSAG